MFFICKKILAKIVLQNAPIKYFYSSNILSLTKQLPKLNTELLYTQTHTQAARHCFLSLLPSDRRETTQKSFFHSDRIFSFPRKNSLARLFFFSSRVPCEREREREREQQEKRHIARGSHAYNKVVSLALARWLCLSWTAPAFVSQSIIAPVFCRHPYSHCAIAPAYLSRSRWEVKYGSRTTAECSMLSIYLL